MVRYINYRDYALHNFVGWTNCTYMGNSLREEHIHNWSFKQKILKFLFFCFLPITCMLHREPSLILTIHCVGRHFVLLVFRIGAEIAEQ